MPLGAVDATDCLSETGQALLLRGALNALPAEPLFPAQAANTAEEFTHTSRPTAYGCWLRLKAVGNSVAVFGTPRMRKLAEPIRACKVNGSFDSKTSRGWQYGI